MLSLVQPPQTLTLRALAEWGHVHSSFPAAGQPWVPAPGGLGSWKRQAETKAQKTTLGHDGRCWGPRFHWGLGGPPGGHLQG